MKIISLSGVLCGIALFFCSCQKREAKNVRVIESMLGTNISGNCSAAYVNVERRPDYGYVEMMARVVINKNDWEAVCDKLHLNKSSPPYLASKNIPKDAMPWWNAPAPELQIYRAGLIGDRGVLSTLWWDGSMYIEFSGYPPFQNR